MITIQCVTICTVDNILCMYDFMLWLHFYFMPCFYMCIPCFYHVCILWKCFVRNDEINKLQLLLLSLRINHFSLLTSLHAELFWWIIKYSSTFSFISQHWDGIGGSKSFHMGNTHQIDIFKNKTHIHLFGQQKQAYWPSMMSVYWKQ